MLHILRAPLIYHPFFFVSRYFATFFLFLFFFLPHSPSSWFNHNLLSSFLRFSYYMISLFFSSLHVIRLYLHPIFSSPPSPFSSTCSSHLPTFVSTFLPFYSLLSSLFLSSSLFFYLLLFILFLFSHAHLSPPPLPIFPRRLHSSFLPSSFSFPSLLSLTHP